MSLTFAALLAATFVVPGHTPEYSPAAGSSARVIGAGSTAKSIETDNVSEPELDEKARGFLATFVDKGNSFGGVTALKILFATVPDPIETHLAAAFDHDVAALQDGVQDSGFLFDSSWIVWDLQRTYEGIDDEVKAERQHRLQHRYPGILLFRKNTSNVGENPYSGGLIVFLLTEKPTAGISIDQAQKAIELITPVAPQPSFTSAGDTAFIAGPTFSGSLDSLVPLVRVLKDAQKAQPLNRILVRSSGFTDSDVATAVATSIAREFRVNVDLGSAEHPLKSWTDSALGTLKNLGIEPEDVAVISEGESLFGNLPPTPKSKPEDPSDPISNKRAVFQKDSGPRSQGGPWRLQFPRDISALRSTYENQGVFDNQSNPEIGRRWLHLKAEEARSGDSIRAFGSDDTVAAQESVLLGISEFLRSHWIHAVIIVASSEQDRYFLTRFLHANNGGVRVVIVGASRLFLRGATAQFRGDMMVSSFPLMPQLYDWTQLSGSIPPNPAAAKDQNQANCSGQSQAHANAQPLEPDETQHIFPNDSSAGEYIAVRDLLWEVGTRSLPGEYSRPRWDSIPNFSFKPPIYVTVLGASSAWPSTAFDSADGFKTAGAEEEISVQVKPTPAKTSRKAAAKIEPKDRAPQTKIGWSVTMPFHFGDHLVPTGVNQAALEIRARAPWVDPSGFWKMMLYICAAIPLGYCIAIAYADPVRKRSFAYLQLPVYWQHWILLATVPAVLSQISFLPLANIMAFPSGVLGHHKTWYNVAFSASFGLPLLVLVTCFWKGWRVRCFRKESDPIYRFKSFLVLGVTASVLVFVDAAFQIYHLLIYLGHPTPLTDFLHAYREMHWDSGLSLLPTVELLILAIAVWNWQALIGISVLHQRPRLPILPDDDRIGDTAADRIAAAGRCLPSRYGARGFWRGYGAAAAVIMGAIVSWPAFRAITSFSSRLITNSLLALAGVAFLLIIMDVMQFAWLWNELHELFLVLNRQPFKRSFIALRDFNWSSIWAFSGGSFKEKRKVLAALFETATKLHAQRADFVSSQQERTLQRLHREYARLDVDASLIAYRFDLKSVHKTLADIASHIASEFHGEINSVTTSRSVLSAAAANDPFRDEELELEQLPEWLRIWERFLCLLYIAFIRVIIARLRTLAISIVTVFSLVALALAVYPYEPMLPIFVVATLTLLAIAVVMFVVFSQMDKDPVLARILQSNPNKLEWSFYGKFLDTLALPLLTVLSTLLPGGAGRLIDLLRMAFSHTQ